MRLSHLIGVTLLGFPHSPISPVMLALVCGIAVRNLTGVAPALLPGIGFTARRVLRWGIILLGLRMGFLDAAGLLRAGAPVVIVGVAVGIAAPYLLNRWLRQPGRLVTLIGVGTSICGVSAIAALSPGIGAGDEETAYAVATITLFGLLATVLYPMLAALLFNGDTVATGIFLGVAIHDTSQVTGAAFLYQDYFADPAVVDVATVTKLLRNSLMLIVVPALSYSHNRNAGSKRRQPQGASARVPVPWFVVGFVLLTLVRAAGDYGAASESARAFALLEPVLWNSIIRGGQSVSSFLIVAALGAVGMNTPFSVFGGLGVKPLIIGLIAALLVGLAAGVAIAVGITV